MKGVLPSSESLPVPGMVCESGAPPAITQKDAEAGFWGTLSTRAHSPCKIHAESDSWIQDGCSSHHSSPVKEWMPDPIFLDAEAMKEKVRQALHKPTYNVANFYKETGVWQEIARNPKFESVVLSVISINALWIAVDTEWNDAKVLNAAPLVFQFAAHSFCAFFFMEWFVRFMAFEVKRNGLRDAWFVFDSVMMCMMVLETWVMSFYIYTTGSSTAIAGGNSSILRLLRLLRLSRVARVAKLLRALPDLMILLKGLLAAVRSVFFTFCLLLLIIYVFAIAIKQMAAETRMGSRYFGGVVTSMYTLFVRGALLDEIAELLNDAFEESPLVGSLLILFILAAAVTVMNMLIGVLCQVVTTVAEVEKEEMTVVVFESKLRAVASRLDQDKDGTICKEEFCGLLGDAAACKALQEVGVDAVGLIDYADIIFEAEEGKYDKTLSFGEFIEVMLDFRGSSTATVKDIVDLRKYTRNVQRRTTFRMDQCNSRLARIEEGMNRLLGADSPCKREGRRTGSQSLQRSSSMASISWSPGEYNEVKRISVQARRASNSDIASEDDLPSPTPFLQSPQSVATQMSSTRESYKNESTELVRLVEKIDKTLNARLSELQSLMGDVVQDRRCGTSPPKSSTASPGPSAWATQVPDASTSCMSSHAGPARSLLAILPIGSEGTKRDADGVAGPQEAVRFPPCMRNSQ